MITVDVIEARDEFGLAGMNITQLDIEGGNFLPERILEHSISYTGTHDNDTLCGWAHSLHHETQKNVAQRLHSSYEEIPEKLLMLTLTLKSSLVVIPIQDYLFLGSEARINTPGKFDGIYRWRLQKKRLDEPQLA